MKVKQMKKTLTALLTLVMCFFLYACGDDTSDVANIDKTIPPSTTAMPTEPETEPPVPTIKDVYIGKTGSTGTVVIENDDNSSLTEDEERLLKYLKNSTDSFNNPTSVRVVEVYAYDEDEDIFYVDISAENSLGGNTLELYEVSKNDIHESITSRSMFEYITLAPGNPCSCDISTINKLLKEYYSEMGWD